MLGGGGPIGLPSLLTKKGQEMTNKTELHPRIEGLVREAIAEANGNAAQAAATLERRIRNDSRLLAALMNPLVRDACYKLVKRTHDPSHS